MGYTNVRATRTKCSALRFIEMPRDVNSLPRVYVSFIRSLFFLPLRPSHCNIREMHIYTALNVMRVYVYIYI